MSSWLRTLAVGLVAFVLVSCSGGGSSGSTHRENGQPLSVAVFNPFTGPDAAFGPNSNAGCFPFAAAVEAGGGILGHKQIKCVPVDTRGDPADAVPAARQAVATLQNLVAILGPSSDEALATAPIFNADKIPMMADTGQVAFDHTSEKYFWRDTPSDDFFGYGMALYAHDMGWNTAATIFGNDLGSQGTVPTVTAGFQKLGGRVVLNEVITLDQTSYRSEVERVLAAKPDVIFNEMDPQTAATFFGELHQLSGGHDIPMVSNAAQYTPWLQAVSKAIGTATIKRIYHNVIGASSTSGLAYHTFVHFLLSEAANVPNPKQWQDDAFAQANYDGLMAFALAMLAAKTTDNAVWNNYVMKVTTARPGAVVVHTFAEGKKALAEGKQIDYVGVIGQMAFTKWHNSGGGFEVLGYAPTVADQPVLKVYSAQSVLKAE